MQFLNAVSLTTLVWYVVSSSMAAAQPPPPPHNVTLCQSYDLTFDNTPDVSPVEARGLILTQDYYQSVGITRLACIRANKTPASSTCRLFDTAQPVGLWGNPPCDCAPTTCQPVNRCGDPDLASNSLGNILVIEERHVNNAPWFPPDDAASGGTIFIDFAVPTTVLSMGFMDIEEQSPVIMEVRTYENVSCRSLF